MNRKEMIKKGFSLLKTYELNLEESRLIIEEIEKNSNILTKDVILAESNKESVFFDEGSELVIKSDFLKKIEERNPEFDLIFSILSIKGNDGHHYQLVSLDKNGNVFVNFRLLAKKLTFNEYYYNYLYELKYEQYTLSNILNILFRGFIPYAERYFKQQYSGVFEQFPIFRKIETLVMLIEMTNSFGKPEEKVYVYYLDKYRVFEKLKDDISYFKSHRVTSKENTNLLLLKNGFPLRNKSFFKFETKIPHSVDEINEKTGLSYYQSVVINSMKRNDEYVLGLAGSGKTYMISVLTKVYLLFKAVWFANTRKGLPITYVSYSKESVLESYRNKMGDFSLYFEKGGDASIVDFQRKLARMDDYFDEENDMERLRKLDSAFRNKRDIYSLIKKAYEYDEYVTERINKIMKEEEVKAFLSVLKRLEKTKEGFTVADKMKKIFYSLIKKEEMGKAVFFSKEVINVLKFKIGNEVKELKKVDYLKIDELLKKYKGYYSENIKKHISSVEEFLTPEKDDDEMYVINLDELDYENIFFYVKNMWRLLSDEEIKKIKNSLSKMCIKSEDLLSERDMDNIHKMATLCMPVEEIFNVSPKYKNFVTFIDESLLISQFLYYSIFSRTLKSYSFGDINQLNLTFLYNKSSLFEKIKKIYVKNKITDTDEILTKNIFLNEKYNVASVWDALFKMYPNGINLLIDNFRNIKYLVYTLIKTNSTYITYIKHFVVKNKNKILPEIVRKIEKAETIDEIIEIVNVYNNEIIKFKNFEGEETDVPLFVFDTGNFKNRVEMFKRFIEFIKIQDFEINSVLFVSVFKQDIPDIKKDLKSAVSETGIEDIKMDVLPSNKIQALEYDIVVLILEESNSRKYLIENDKLLNVIISRARKGFIIVCDAQSCSNSVLGNTILTENSFQLVKP